MTHFAAFSLQGKKKEPILFHLSLSLVVTPNRPSTVYGMFFFFSKAGWPGWPGMGISLLRTAGVLDLAIRVYCVTNKTCSKEITQNRPIRIGISQRTSREKKRTTTAKGCFACYIIIWSRGWWLCFGNAFLIPWKILPASSSHDVSWVSLIYAGQVRKSRHRRLVYHSLDILDIVVAALSRFRLVEETVWKLIFYLVFKISRFLFPVRTFQVGAAQLNRTMALVDNFPGNHQHGSSRLMMIQVKIKFKK